MRQITSFLFLFVCCVVILSCNNPIQKEFEFYYYPARNVYYSVTNNLYFYSLDGGKSWDSVSAYANKQPVTLLGSKQIIYSTTPEIWLDNKEHVSQYKGQVINVVDNDSSLAQSNSVAERKTKKVIQPAVTEPEKKSEKKPGFFQRLFGKKNK